MPPKSKTKAPPGRRNLDPKARSRKRPFSEFSNTVQNFQAKRSRLNPRTANSRASKTDNGHIDKEPVIIGSSSGTPIVLTEPTSYASRKRNRVTLSMKEVLADRFEDEDVPIDYASKFDKGSMAHYTWGVISDKPVSAIRKKRRHAGLSALNIRRGKMSAFEPFELDENARDQEKQPEAFRFLDLPLEIRQNVYKFLLIHDSPIILDSDWHRVHYGSGPDHKLLCVNKQISLEGTRFIYEQNVFQSLIEAPTHSWSNALIKKDFLPLFRNVIIKCPANNFSQMWLDRIATCINHLIDSETFLDTLTMVISTRSDGTHPSVVGLGPGRITCLDLFHAPKSSIMRTIPKIRCKVWNIIIRLPENKRVLVSIDLRGLPANQDKSGWLAEDKVAQQSEKRRARRVKTELMRLKIRIEAIFLDHEKAILEG